MPGKGRPFDKGTKNLQKYLHDHDGITKSKKEHSKEILDIDEKKTQRRKPDGFGKSSNDYRTDIKRDRRKKSRTFEDNDYGK